MTGIPMASTANQWSITETVDTPPSSQISPTAVSVDGMSTHASASKRTMWRETCMVVLR